MDTTPPTITVLAAPPSEPDSWTTNTQPTFSAQITDDYRVDWSSLGVYLETYDAGNFGEYLTPTSLDTGTGCFACTPNAPLPEGHYWLEVWVKDVASNGNPNGNWAELVRECIVETGPPVISNLYPPNGSYVYDPQPIIQAEISDAGAGVNWERFQVTLDEALITPNLNEGSFRFYEPTLQPGWHYVDITVYDLAEHQAHANWCFKYVEDIAPTVQNVSPPDGSWVYNDPNPIISGEVWSETSAIDWSTMYVAVDDVSIWPPGGAEHNVIGSTFVCQPRVRLWTGTHSVYAAVCDIAGNWAEKEWSFTYVDTEPISFMNLAPAEWSSLYNTPAPTISADIYGHSAAINWSSLFMLVDARQVIPTQDGAHIAYTTSSLAAGQHYVWITIHDNAGNFGQIGWYFYTIADTTAPVITHLSPGPTSVIYDSDWLLIYASFSDGQDGFDFSSVSGIEPSSAKIYIDNQDTPLDNTYAWDIGANAFSTPLPAGDHFVKIVVADKAGNSASRTSYFAVVATPNLVVYISPTYGALPLLWTATACVYPGMGEDPIDVTADTGIVWTGGPATGAGPHYVIPVGATLGDYSITVSATYTTTGVGDRSLGARSRALAAGLVLSGSATRRLSIKQPPSGGDPRAAEETPPPPGQPPPAADAAFSGVSKGGSADDFGFDFDYTLNLDANRRYIQHVKTTVYVCRSGENGPLTWTLDMVDHVSGEPNAIDSHKFWKTALVAEGFLQRNTYGYFDVLMSVIIYDAGPAVAPFGHATWAGDPLFGGVGPTQWHLHKRGATMKPAPDTPPPLPPGSKQVGHVDHHWCAGYQWPLGGWLEIWTFNPPPQSPNYETP